MHQGSAKTMQQTELVSACVTSHIPLVETSDMAKSTQWARKDFVLTVVGREGILWDSPVYNKVLGNKSV